jgi:hypothetical protein
MNQIHQSSRTKTNENDVVLKLGCNGNMNVDCNMETEGVIQSVPCHSVQQDLNGCEHSEELQDLPNGHQHNPGLPFPTADLSSAENTAGLEEMAASGLADMWNYKDCEGKGLEVSNLLLSTNKLHDHSHMQHHSSHIAPVPVAQRHINLQLSQKTTVIDPANLSPLGLNKTADFCAVPIEGTGILDSAVSSTRRPCLEVMQTLQPVSALSSAWGRIPDPEGKRMLTASSNLSSAAESSDQEHEDCSESMSYQSVESSRLLEGRIEEAPKSADCTELEMGSNGCALLPATLEFPGINSLDNSDVCCEGSCSDLRIGVLRGVEEIRGSQSDTQEDQQL